MHLIKAFEKSMQEYDLQHKSKYWRRYDARRVLYTEESLENFRNNSLSDDLDDRFDSPLQKEIFCDLLIELGKDFVFANLTDKNVGNAKECFIIDQRFVDAGQNIHIKWLHDLERLVFSHMQVKRICEIGGGYGSLAQKIASNIRCHYILIDLPEANLLSAYYLTQHFPQARFLLADAVQDGVVSQDEIDSHDFIIIPPWYAMGDTKIDLFINTRSMMEMNAEVIRGYFDRIQRTVSDQGFFFNVNRYRKDKVGYPIKLSEYPYDEQWKVVSSAPSWKQDHIHQLVTERCPVGQGDIREELAKIEERHQCMQSKVKKGKKGILGRLRRLAQKAAW